MAVRRIRFTRSTPVEDNNKDDKAKIHVQRDLSIVDDTWSTLKTIQENPPTGWKNLFSDFGNAAKNIDRLMTRRGRFIPLPQEIFLPFDLTPLESVKVVILGKCPHHTIGIDRMPRTNGLAYSHRREAPINAKTRCIFDEVARSYPTTFKRPNHGDLSGWAKQGVLLLNLCLTTEPGTPEAHLVQNSTINLWSGLIDYTFKLLREHRPHCIMMLWGRYIQDSIEPGIKEALHTLESNDPESYGFLGNNHFILANEHLKSKGMSPIDWCNLD